MTDTLNTAWAKLRAQWENSTVQWKDKARSDFEQRYWLTLKKQTQLTQREIEKLVSTIADAKRHVK